MLAQAAHLLAGLAWTQLFAFLLPALAGAAGANLRPSAYLRLAVPRPKVLLLGLGAGVAGFLAGGAIMVLTQRLLPASWVETFDLTRVLDRPAHERIAFALLAALLAPLCEEIAFRGYLQTTLLLRRPPRAAIGAGALVFAAIHLDPVRFPALLLLGAVFGWLAWRAGSVWPAVAAHLGNNALGAAVALSVEPGATAAAGEQPPLPAIALWIAIGLSVLGGVLVAYREATPAPPDPASALVPRDPALPVTRFSPARMPAWAALGTSGGFFLLGLVALAAAR
jgi:hypothetical protein